MIFSARLDLHSPVELLEHHDPRKLVREGHGGHGKPQAGRLFDFIRQTERAANIQRNVTSTLNRPFFYRFRQLWR